MFTQILTSNAWSAKNKVLCIPDRQHGIVCDASWADDSIIQTQTVSRLITGWFDKGGFKSVQMDRL